MPEMDGISTMKVLKTSGYNIPPVIALTANAIKGAREKYLEAGFEDYVEKPINSKILGSIIQKNLSQDLIEFIKKENEEFSNVAFGLFENMEEIIENVGGLDTYNEILKNYYLAIDCIENEINETAKYLLENNICLIYKKATPIKIDKIESVYTNKGKL